MPCSIVDALVKIIQLYVLIMLVYAIISWVPSLRGRWTQYVAMLVEPVLLPLRRIIPPIGGLDLSFLVVILVIQWVLVPFIARIPCTF